MRNQNYRLHTLEHIVTLWLLFDLAKKNKNSEERTEITQLLTSSNLHFFLVYRRPELGFAKPKFPQKCKRKIILTKFIYIMFLETCDIWDTDYNCDNLCDLTIKSGTGQHFQFLQCLYTHSIFNFIYLREGFQNKSREKYGLLPNPGGGGGPRG